MWPIYLLLNYDRRIGIATKLISIKIILFEFRCAEIEICIKMKWFKSGSEDWNTNNKIVKGKGEQQLLKNISMWNINDIFYV